MNKFYIIFIVWFIFISVLSHLCIVQEEKQKLINKLCDHELYDFCIISKQTYKVNEHIIGEI